ncbi:MAG: ATP-binding cassette domain-containing protein [Gammaproteobacteria bacterium]|nr:ATP-binding cassette domain-containing protein [Gammaproteobacteria bacterium]
MPCAGNLPIDLDDPQSIWFIEKGAVDLFLVERQGGVDQASPQHLFRAHSGRLLPGVVPQEGDTTFGLAAKGLPDTVLWRLSIADLSVVPNAELAEHVDAWIADVSTELSRDAGQRPRPDTPVEPGKIFPEVGGTLSSRQGVVWVSQLSSGAGLFLGLIDPVEGDLYGEPASGTVPLTPATWLTLMEKTKISIRSSENFAKEGLLLSALANFHVTAFSHERFNRNLAVADQANLERDRVTSRRSDEEHARHRLFNLYDLPDEEKADVDGTALHEVLKVIGEHEGIDFKWPAKSGVVDSAPTLGDVLDASGVRGRQVRLTWEERWWIGDSGAMLAFREADGQPVALLPGMLGHYQETEIVGQRGTRVTPERAKALDPDAWVFYQPLSSGKVGWRDLYRLVRKGLVADFLRFATAGLLGGLVILVPAVVVGFVVDEVIPTGEISLLYLATATLAAFALVGALLHILQGMALMRLEGRGASRLEAAFWDRLLRLPLSFLRRYPAGNLAMRGMTFQALRDAVRAVIANAVLSIIFLLPAFLLISYYDEVLGTVTAAFGFLSLVVIVVLGLQQISPYGQVMQTVHHMAGQLFQFINGISKLRIDDAEGSAFAILARGYREQKRAESKLGALEDHLQAFGAALPLLAGAVLFLMMMTLGREGLEIGDFLVIYLVFIAFQAAVARLGASFSAVVGIMLAFDQIRPFLSETPETSSEGELVESLGGEVVFDHITFRYDPEGPLILDDVTIRANPGEFVAIAGESGAGKSTIFRIALGLDHPSSGAVYYDGRDLQHLNLKQVRRKIGAVPQDLQLHPEDVWDNIVGDREGVTSDVAWTAAKAASVDRDIMRMPMGMLTCVGGGGLTSGGESQRIVIAHALIETPRVMLLDEATNWLDNDNQARVMDNLASLRSTRIVIAHRLSTLRQADRIYVMQAGKVVEVGTFETLMEVGGVFQDLVRRQVA